MIPKIYRWDDANAPVCNGTYGALVNLLRACLIDGYGDKTPPGGWSIQFMSASGFSATFQNNKATGTGFYLDIEGDTTTADYVSVQGYELATSLGVGMGAFLPSRFSFMVAYGAGTILRPWVLVATDVSFYFFSFFRGTVSPLTYWLCPNVLFFGDFKPFFDDDAFNCALMFGDLTVNTATNGILRSYGNSYVASTYCGCPRDMTGTPESQFSPTVNVGGPGGITNYSARYGVIFDGTTLFVGHPFISDSSAGTIRGWLPGSIEMCHSHSGFDFLTFFDHEGRSLIVMKVQGYQFDDRATTVFALEVGNNWAW